MKVLIIIFLTMAALVSTSCGSASTSPSSAREEVRKAVPKFDADTAFAFVKAQTDMGPRVPGTAASEACGDWIVATLERLGAQNIIEQCAHVRAWNGTELPIRNISAQLRPQARKRILLLAHWDSRPWADHDSDPARREKPIEGANDGASGVGVILEIVRQISLAEPSVGVDVLFVDAEDYGRRAEFESADDDSWALGTQYWLTALTIDLKAVRYAVLLDMVGGRGAVFPREYFSERGARDVNDKVWKAARKAGHSSRFPNTQGGAVTDDHVYLLRAGIPAIDIIESANPVSGTFNPTWHTADDTIDNIDPATLEAVGQTLLTLIYSE